MIREFASRGGALTPAPFYLWGIVNATPDSFHDGGLWFSPEKAVEHARQLRNEGAAILDIGGASSRPGAADVPAEEETRRVLPIVRALLEERGSDRRAGMENTAPEAFGISGTSGFSDTVRPAEHAVRFPADAPANSCPGASGHEQGDLPAAFSGRPLVSVDTWRADTAAACLEAGADIINDISAFEWEPALLDVVASFRPGYVLMHCQGRPGTMQSEPRYSSVTDEVLDFFVEKMNALVRSGLPEERVILDPGIGFGKSVEHNLTLLRDLPRLESLGRPLLLGISHKSFLGALTGLPQEGRGPITQVCSALLYERGVRHHRVHDVAGTRNALILAAALQGV